MTCRRLPSDFIFLINSLPFKAVLSDVYVRFARGIGVAQASGREKELDEEMAS